MGEMGYPNTWLSFVCLTYFNHFNSFYFFIFFNFFNFLNYFISYHFFSTIFFNFSNLYILSLNFNYSYHLEISKVKLFLHHFSKQFSNNSKSFSNYFYHPNKWDGMGKMPSPNKGLPHVWANRSTRLITFHIIPNHLTF